MASSGTLSSAQSSTPGPWAESTFAASVNLSFAVTTQVTFAFATQGSGSKPNFLPTIPVAAVFPAVVSNAYPIQANSNTGLPAGCGLVSVAFDSTSAPTEVILVFSNSSTNVTATIAAGQRVIFLECEGI